MYNDGPSRQPFDLLVLPQEATSLHISSILKKIGETNFFRPRQGPLLAVLAAPSVGYLPDTEEECALYLLS